MEEVKIEENNRSKSKYYTRPLKAKMISFESLKASQASVKKEDNSKDVKPEDKSSVAQSNASSRVKKEHKEHRKIKSTDPSEDDLCEALMIIKKKLNHRSL